jgi:hypothetical protein
MRFDHSRERQKLDNRLLRPCLGQGAPRRARVGRLGSLAFLSLLPEHFPLVQGVQAIEDPLGQSRHSIDHLNVPPLSRTVDEAKPEGAGLSAAWHLYLISVSTSAP